MTEDDKLTLELTMDQTQFLTALLRSIVKSDEFPDNYRETAQAIRNNIIDSALLEGKIGIDDLPPGDFSDEG